MNKLGMFIAAGVAALCAFGAEAMLPVEYQEVEYVVLIECHGRFDLPTALRHCNALEQFNPYWVEEPIIPDTMRALADLRSRVRVPIACGERLYMTQQIMDAVELRCCDYLHA